MIFQVLDFFGKVVSWVPDSAIARSRILQRKWVTETANGYRRELYFRSHILQGTKGDLRGGFLKGTKRVFRMMIYRSNELIVGLEF